MKKKQPRATKKTKELADLKSGPDWKWYGFACHFFGGRNCGYHLATRIGKYLISTVGAYRPKSDGKEEEVGINRLFETMVFECGGDDQDGNPRVASWSEIDGDGYNDSREAEIGHYKTCWKYQDKQPGNDSELPF